MNATIRRPSAWVPLAMSLTALAIVLVHLALVGAARQADEGLAAHLWQLLIGVQIPLVAWFAVTWLPRAPRPALAVLVCQGLALFAALAPVFVLQW
jgi:hypothetical protein